MTAKLEKGGGTFQGIKMLLCENPLPPLDEATDVRRRTIAPSLPTGPHTGSLLS